MSETDGRHEGASKAELDLNQFLPYRFNNLAERLSESLAGIYQARFGISIPEWRVLAWLSYRDVMTAKAICEVTHMDKARVSRAVKRLEGRELICRTPAQHDQRQQLLRLTEAGHALLAELIPQAREWESKLVSTLTAREYRDLMATISKLERQLTRMAEGSRKANSA